MYEISTKCQERTLTWNFTAANGTSIPYKGWVEVTFRLNSEEETKVTVPFLVAEEYVDQPIICYNVISLLVKNNNNVSENSTLVQSITSSFGNLEEKHARQLVNLIETNHSDYLCEVKSVKRDIVIPKGATTRVPCRANAGSVITTTSVCLSLINNHSGLLVKLFKRHLQPKKRENRPFLKFQ